MISSSNQNMNSQNSISSKQKAKHEVILNRYVCKFIGTKDHGKKKRLTKIFIRFYRN